MQAVYVIVNERCLENGHIIPLSIIWDMTEYKIDRVVDVRRDVIRKTGEVAMRYLVEIRGQQRYLFRSTLNRWLLLPEEKHRRKRVHSCRDMVEERIQNAKSAH